MGEIKSALEIALERAEKLGKASREEMDAEKWNEHGKRIAASFLQGKELDILNALSSVPSEFVRNALEGATDVLLRNIVLPQDEMQWDGIKKAMEGLVAIKGSVASQILPQVEQLLRNYQQTLTQYQEQFQQQLQARMGAMKSMGQGVGGMDQAELSNLMQAQDEWNKLSAEIRQQFEQQLDSMKQFLRG